MSRVGKKPVPVPQGVTASVDGQTVKMKGTKGELAFVVPEEVSVVMEDGSVAVQPRDQTKVARSKWGLSRAMIANIATGVSKGFERKLEINGVGYRVHIPTSTFEGLPEKGKDVKLLTYQHVRENDITLFGFASTAERAVFEVMLGVSGVGPKLALAALSAMSPVELRDHVVEGDTSLLTNIPGVGRKTADRLVVELRDRLANLEVLERAAAPLSGGSEARAAARRDALAALEELGFSRAAAERAVRKALRQNAGVQSADQLVRLALREQ